MACHLVVFEAKQGHGASTSNHGQILAYMAMVQASRKARGQTGSIRFPLSVPVLSWSLIARRTAEVPIGMILLLMRVVMLMLRSRPIPLLRLRRVERRVLVVVGVIAWLLLDLLR